MSTAKSQADKSLIPEERRRAILERVQRRGGVSVTELALWLAASESTIRRDLEELARRGAVERSHGGATISLSQRSTFEPDYEYASRMAMDEKERIGRAAAGELQDGQCVLFDSSSTVFKAAQCVAASGLNLTAVTNDLNISMLLAQASQIRVLNVGGTLRPGSFTLLGEPGLDFLNRLQVDVCFLGIQAISQDGLSDTSLEVAAMKICMVRASTKVVLLADASKFGKKAFCRVCSLSDIDQVVSDRGLAQKHLKHLAEWEVEVSLV